MAESPSVDDRKLLSESWGQAPSIEKGNLLPSPGVYYPRTPSSPCGSRFRGFQSVLHKVRRRIVKKNGECNVLQANVDRRYIRFLQDIFITLLDCQWRITLLVFSFSFILSWLGFGGLYWLISIAHGDLEDAHLPPFQEINKWTPCISQIYSFTSCFTFSIETQQTIGYGVRTITEECPEAVFIMLVQSVVGVLIIAIMGAIVFAKISRPKQRTQTLMFSKKAVVCQRDGIFCLMFRVGDMRKSHIIGANIRAELIRSRITKEGEILAQYQTEIDVEVDSCGSNFFFLWPKIAMHKITPESPLFNMTASDLIQERFEIVVILEGTIESSGQTTQARSSYVNTEMLWGHRFEPMVLYNKDKHGYEVDYSKFNATVEVDTPLCSARELAHLNVIQEEYKFIDPEDEVFLPLANEACEV